MSDPTFYAIDGGERNDFKYNDFTVKMNLISNEELSTHLSHLNKIQLSVANMERKIEINHRQIELNVTFIPPAQAQPTQFYPIRRKTLFASIFSRTAFVVVVTR